MISQEQERLLRLSLERAEGNERKLQRPSLSAMENGVQLSKLQSQWILFASIAALAYLGSKDTTQLNEIGLIQLWGLMFSLMVSSLLAWLSLQQWATYFFNKSAYYAKFFSHEILNTRLWYDNMLAGTSNKSTPFEDSALESKFKSNQKWAIRLQSLAAVFFIVGIALSVVTFFDLLSLPEKAESIHNAQDGLIISIQNNE